ncbi:uncharacterized protein LAJ45_05931 [Morchella importuna]|uniref:uncharacterized protein n=1 Tax=Morchella importuna TaxID=1174673 RepID=UPI001E8E776D|nr:uncharacterized protein LAJ45_05931 [Morchella importuna]KAH8149779.1 hypothetical protein LAJ45_05931 [Morchella importuna]
MELGTAIVGLVVAGAQISAVLNRFISSCTNAPSAAHSIYQEVGEFRIVLQKLQHIVFSPEPLDNEKASLIDTGPISFTLVHCVCTFDELEKELKRMKLDEFNLEGKKLGVWHRMRWSLVEQTMSAMILRIQNHKSTLGILLSVLLSESINDVKDLMQDLHTLVAQGVVALPKSREPDSDLRSLTSQDTAETSSDNYASSIRTTTGSFMQRSQYILPSLHSTLFSSRPYRNRSSSESIISVATSKRRGGSWSLDAGDSRYSVFSLPVSISTTSGISLAEAPPISQIHLTLPTQIVHGCNWSTNFHSDPSRLYELLTAEEKKIWLVPSPKSLDGSLLLKAVYKGLTTIVFLLLLDPSTPKDRRTQDGYTALDLAAEYGHVEIVQRLLEKGTDVNSRSNNGYSALHRAVKGGSFGLIQLLLDAGADMEAITHPEYHTPLHLAARHADLDVVALLLDRGANADGKAADGLTPLHLAARDGFLEVVGLLLDRGANVDAKTARNHTPLHLAVRHGLLEVAGLLLEKGANIEVKAANEDRPLHLAVKHGCPEVVGLLLDNGTNIEVKAANEDRPLHLAVRHGHLEIVGLLLDKGANTDVKATYGHTPLHLAARYADLKAIGRLLDSGANIDVKAADGHTPLHLAARDGFLEVVSLLLDRGANIDAKAADEYTPLHLVVKHGLLEVVGLLLDEGANIDAKAANGYTPLHLAAKHGLLEIARLLLDEGADIHATSTNDETPLHLAVKQGISEVARLLLDEGANIEAKAADEHTPLHLAVKHDQIITTGLLLAKGANIDAETSNKETPLHLAHKVSVNILKRLLHARESLDGKKNKEETALREGISYQEVEITRSLLGETDANVSATNTAGNMVDTFGVTPRTIPSIYESLDDSSASLEEGADIEAKDSDGESTLHHAYLGTLGGRYPVDLAGKM